MTRRGRLIARLVSVMLSLLAVFVLLEAGFRLSRLRLPDVVWAVYDEELGYRLNPAFADSNELGLRDHPITEKGGRFRLLMLGDSVGYYGETIDDTWVGRLEIELARSAGGRRAIDVVNSSVRGYTNYQELLYLRRDGVLLEPDLVGVGFVLNDLFKFLTSFKVENGRIVDDQWDFSNEAESALDSWLYTTLRRSQFLVWLRRRLDGLDASTLVTAGQGFSFDHRPDFQTAWRDEPWAMIDEQLREMKELGEANGFGLFVVVFPFADQYRPEYLERDRDHVLKPQLRLAEICAELGIPLLDLYPDLDPVRDLTDDKIHLTATGRKRVAGLVADYLRRERLLPDLSPAEPGAAGEPEGAP